MLNLKPYLTEIEDIEPGQTIKINHTDCEAGEDTRRRLYLTRTHADETRVIAYCHNCQQGGYHSDGHYKAYRNNKHKAPKGGVVEIKDEVSKPVGLVEKIADWPTSAKAWAYSRGITQDDAYWYGVEYDPSTNRVYLPRWTELDRRNEDRGVLAGYQLRALDRPYAPKYMTAQRQDVENYTFIHPKQNYCDYAVIVEDLVSAIHILRATENEGEGANLPGVYVNYGTRVDPKMMYEIAQQYTYAVVWLDNDNQHVVNQAKLMQRTIAMYNAGIRAGRVEESSDPKHYAPSEICIILDEVWNGQH